MAFHTVGGIVSGLSDGGLVVVENNGSDTFTLSSNGSFTFPVPVLEGAPYNVTVTVQPLSQTCTVTNGSGLMGPTDVTNVAVTCVFNP